MGRLHELHSRLKTTFIHICHRVEETLSLGDTLAVMRHGLIEQKGTPRELFYHPKNLFVAQFLNDRNAVGAGVNRPQASATRREYFPRSVEAGFRPISGWRSKVSHIVGDLRLGVSAGLLPPVGAGLFPASCLANRLPGADREPAGRRYWIAGIPTGSPRRIRS